MILQRRRPPRDGELILLEIGIELAAGLESRRLGFGNGRPRTERQMADGGGGDISRCLIAPVDLGDPVNAAGQITVEL